MLVPVREQSVPRENKGEVRLPLPLQAATARAQLALETAALALPCLLCSTNPHARSRAMAVLHGAAMNFLHCFATTPIILYRGGSRCACPPVVCTCWPVRNIRVSETPARMAAVAQHATTARRPLSCCAGRSPAWPSRAARSSRRQRWHQRPRSS